MKLEKIMNMTFENIMNISEHGFLIVAASVWTSVSILQFRKLFSDNTNKEVIREIAEFKKEVMHRIEDLEEEVKTLRKGYVSPEVLKDKIPYFVQGNRWKIQKIIMDILSVNNISKNPYIVDKKLDYLYDKAKNRMSEMLEGMSDSSTKYIILQSFTKNLNENRAVIDALFAPLKKEHEKSAEEECRKNLQIEMEQFQERTITDIKELF